MTLPSEPLASNPVPPPPPVADAVQAGQPSLPATASEPTYPRSSVAAPTQAWWQTAWAARAALLLILLLAAYFRFLGLTTWDKGTGQHPDERFFQDVTASVRLPTSFADYFDATQTQANPRNVGKGFFVYGTSPILLTRAVAISLTPQSFFEETIPNPRAGQPGEPDTLPNPEYHLPRLTLLQAWLNPKGENLAWYGGVVNVGRVLVVLFDLASIGIVYLIGVRLYDRRVGLLAALLAALAVMSIQQSHFYVDPNFSTLFGLMALYYAVRIAQGAGWHAYILMGIGIGGGMANRITLAALGLIGIVAAVQAALVWSNRKRKADTPFQLGPFLTAFFGRALSLLCVAGLITLLTFRILQPYAFIGSTPTTPPLPTGEPSRLDGLHGMGFFDIRPEPRYLDNMQSVARLVSGEDDFNPSQQWVGQPSYIYPMRNMVLWGMGLPLGIAAWVGWAVAGVVLLRHTRRLLNVGGDARVLAPLVPWVWVGFYFVWQGNQFAMNMRYMLPIYGALTVFAAWLLVALWQWGREPQLPPALTRGQWLTRPPFPLLARLALVVVVLGTLAWAYAFSRIYTRPHARIAAAQWVMEHIPPGARITFEEWDDPLPMNIFPNDPWGTMYQGIKTRPYAMDEPQKYYGNGVEFGLLDQLDEADYITLTSNRVYGSTKNLPMRYPALQRYYAGLFDGSLGFELVADITSYPTLLGIPIPTQSADESFTVYDHPRVLIFRKTPQYSRERAEQVIVQGVNWSEVMNVGVKYAERSHTGLRFTPEQWPRYRAGGTWAAAFDPASPINSDLLAPLVWLLTLELLGLAAFALLFRWLHWLPDRGLTLARVMGLLWVAWLAWLLGSFKLLPFSTPTVWLAATPLLAGGAWAAWHSRSELRVFWHERRNAILTAQALYLLAFAAMLLLRWQNPDLWHPARGGEKPMDFGYLNAVLRSAAFPPVDPWFAGGHINYYYFGFVIVGTLIHLTTIVPDVAYNLAIPTLFALVAVGAWGIIYNLIAPRSYRLRRLHESAPFAYNTAGVAYTIQADAQPYAADPVAAPPAAPTPPTAPAPSPSPRWWVRLERNAITTALLAPIFILLLGNLVQALWFLNGYAAANTHRPEWAFWDATRIVRGTINEFPFFTFLFADLHAHMIVMPFALAVVAVLVALVRRPLGLPVGAGVGMLVLLGWLIGTLRVTNTWDFPTFAALTVATLLLLTWAALRRTLAQPSTDSAAWQVLRAGSLWLGQVVLVLGLSTLLFQPFFAHFATESSGIELLKEGGRSTFTEQILFAERTNLWDSLRLYGLWYFILISGGLVLAWRTLRGTDVPARLSESRVLPFLVGIASGIGLWLVWVWLSSSPPPAPAPDQPDGIGGWPALVLLLPLLGAALALLWLLREQHPRKLMPVLWGTLAIGIIAGVEIVRVQGDVGRMNTVFKFGLHAWLLAGLTAAVTVAWLWRLGTAPRSTGAGTAATPAPLQRDNLRAAAWVWRGAVVLLILASLVYPLTATPARLADRYTDDLPQTLHGSRFMENPNVRFGENGRDFLLADDWAAIQWLRANIQGTPIILEAHLPSYRWAGRVAVYTGLPTLLGWEWHQVQQRMAVNTGQVISNRQSAIQQIYGNPDPAVTLQLLDLYGIEYVYVGGVEQALYSPESLSKFETLTAQGALEKVYDSGPTRIYRKVNPGDPTVFTFDLAATPPSMRTPPPLLLATPVNELPAVAGYAWNQSASSNDWLAAGLWWLAFVVLAVLGLPLAVSLFAAWRGDLLVWARLLGLILFSYAVWLPTSYGVWRYDLVGVLGGLGLVLLFNLGLLHWLGRRAAPAAPAADVAVAPAAPARMPVLRGAAHVWQVVQARSRELLAGEAIFVNGFIWFALVRAFNPDLWHPVWGGEKPMEFGFLNAVLRSPVMPPYDPFFSDGYINYYYYGYMLLSIPIKLTGIAPAIAYNLALATLFGLVLAGASSLVAHLTGRLRYGLLAAVLVGVVGNLGGVFTVGWSRGLSSVLQAWRNGDPAGFGGRLGDWFIGPSRIVEGTINEFPYFSFLYADLHPHLIALPITLLAIALALRLYEQHRRVPLAFDGYAYLLYGTAALILGTLAVTNSWDFPTYTLLTGAAMLGAAWRTQRTGVAWGALVAAGVLAAVLAIGGMVLYTPFFDHFYAMVSGIGVQFGGTTLPEYLVLYGIFLAFVLPFVIGVVVRLLWGFWLRPTPVLRTVGVLSGAGMLLLIGIAGFTRPVLGLQLLLLALIGVGVVLFFNRRLASSTWFLLLLVATAASISLGIEYVYIRDHLVGGDFYRMNTVFKFGLQVWVLLALVAAAALPILLRGVGRIGQRTGIGGPTAQAGLLVLLAVPLLAGLVYPLAGTPSKASNRFAVSPPPTLDGLAFLDTATFEYPCNSFPGCPPNMATLTINLEPDAQATAWLNANIEGTPIIVQSPLWFYRAYGIRMAANTGLPTVISALHVNEQRDPVVAGLRDREIDTFFRTTDVETKLRTIAKYRINYIYVGAIEYAFYEAAGLDKFQAMTENYLDVVYNTPGVVIYRVRDVPSNYAVPPPFDFSETARQPGTPPANVLEGPVLRNEGAGRAPAVVEPAADLVQLEQQVQADPTNGPLVFGLAVRYRELGRLDDAAAVLAVAAQANPDDIGVHHLWGDILAQAGRFAEAEVAYRRAAERRPDVNNWNKLATGLLAWGELDKAEAALDLAQAADPNAPEPYFRRGELLLQRNRPEAARTALQRFLELDPQHYLAGRARELLAQLE